MINSGLHFLSVPKSLLPSPCSWFFPPTVVCTMTKSLDQKFGESDRVTSSLLIRPYYPNEFGLGRSFLFNELCISGRIDFRCTFSLLHPPSFPFSFLSSRSPSLLPSFHFSPPIPPVQTLICMCWTEVHSMGRWGLVFVRVCLYSEAS